MNKQNSKRKKRSGMMLLQGLILFHLIWWGSAVLVQTNALPVPYKVYEKLPELMQKGLFQHFMASLNRLLMGLSLSFVLGGALGLLMGRSPLANRILNPLVYFTYPIPKTALLPVVMILFGLGDGSKVTLIVLITIFQVIVAVRDSVLHIESHLYHTMKSLGAGRWQCFWHVTLPAILPDLLTSLRLSVGTALSVLFFAENYGTQYGLGYLVQECWGRLNYTGMYGGILMLSFLGCMLFMVIDGIEWLCCKGR